MTTIAVPSLFIWMTIVLVFILLSLILYLMFFIYKLKNCDKVVMIDKNNRWTIINAKLKGVKKWNYNKNTYHLDPDAGLLSQKGKALYHFSENKPTPLKIHYSKVDWLDAESLSAMINNNIVQQIIKPQDKFIDLLHILGSIGGLLAGLSSVLILLIVSGVIKVGVA